MLICRKIGQEWSKGVKQMSSILLPRLLTIFARCADPDFVNQSSCSTFGASTGDSSWQLVTFDSSGMACQGILGCPWELEMSLANPSFIFIYLDFDLHCHDLQGRHSHSMFVAFSTEEDLSYLQHPMIFLGGKGSQAIITWSSLVVKVGRSRTSKESERPSDSLPDGKRERGTGRGLWHSESKSLQSIRIKEPWTSMNWAQKYLKWFCEGVRVQCRLRWPRIQMMVPPNHTWASDILWWPLAISCLLPQICFMNCS